MKVMRSTKEGSVCKEAVCQAPIKIGDPIAYFGHGNIYGLTCHRNEKTTKHLLTLLREENPEADAAELAELLKQELNGVKETPLPAKPTKGNDVSTQQEWVVRVTWGPEHMKNLGTPEFRLMQWMLQSRYCGQLANTLNCVEYRAPRGIGAAMTKQWAENAANDLNQKCAWLGVAEAAPLWVG